jgi:hypothetical protein
MQIISRGADNRWFARQALVAILALAACTSPGPNGTQTSSPTVRAPTPVASSPEPRTEVEAAVAAYTNMLNAYVAASNAGTDDTTELGKYATAAALQVLSKGLADNKAKGLHTQGTPKNEPPQVTSVAPASAPTSVRVRSCLDDSQWLVYKGNGQPANETPGGRRQATAEVKKTDGVWKVDSFGIRGVGTCS